jgi:hypothetical protein
MARKSKEQKWAVDELVRTAVQHFYEHDGISISYPEGSIHRGGDPSPRANPSYFAPFDATDAEFRAIKAAALDFGDLELKPVELVRPAPARVIADKDAVVSIGIARLAPGLKFHRNDPEVKESRDAFVPMNPDGIERAEAVEALARITHDDRVVHQGQWIHRSDPLIQLHPTQFRLLTLLLEAS